MPVTERFVLLNGPVPECLRLVHGKELPVPKSWNSRFITRNCRFPEVGTHRSQPGNRRLPLQATAGSQSPEVGTPGSQPRNHRLPLQRISGSQKLELTVFNVGTTGYHCNELPVPRSWNSWFPTSEPWATVAKNFQLPNVKAHGCQRGNHRLPLRGTTGSQSLDLLVPNLRSEVTI